MLSVELHNTTAINQYTSVSSQLSPHSWCQVFFLSLSTRLRAPSNVVVTEASDTNVLILASRDANQPDPFSQLEDRHHETHPHHNLPLPTCDFIRGESVVTLLMHDTIL